MTKKVVPFSREVYKRDMMLLFDLYWLRYKKPGDQWYELTDYLRDKLNEDKWRVSYDDKEKDLIYGVGRHSMKEFIRRVKEKK